MAGWFARNASLPLNRGNSMKTFIEIGKPIVLLFIAFGIYTEAGPVTAIAVSALLIFQSYYSHRQGE